MADLILTIDPPIERRLIGVSVDCYVLCQSPVPLLLRDSRVLHVETISPEGLQHLVHTSLKGSCHTLLSVVALHD